MVLGSMAAILGDLLGDAHFIGPIQEDCAEGILGTEGHTHKYKRAHTHKHTNFPPFKNQC